MTRRLMAGLEQSEKEIQNAILQFLDFQPGFYFANQTVGIWDDKIKAHRKNPAAVTGVSDICGYYSDGRAVYIEVKKPSNKRRPPHQVEFIERANANNCIAIFATSLDEVISLFDKLGKGEI